MHFNANVHVGGSGNLSRLAMLGVLAIILCFIPLSTILIIALWAKMAKSFLGVTAKAPKLIKPKTIHYTYSNPVKQHVSFLLPFCNEDLHATFL
jgi:hypothetical protein